MKLQVINSFKDKETKELYALGAEIESTDLGRINDLVGRGLCRIVELGEATKPKEDKEGKISLFEQEFDREKINEALKLTSVKGVIASFKDDTIIAKIAGLSNDELEIFKDALLAD